MKNEIPICLASQLTNIPPPFFYEMLALEHHSSKRWKAYELYKENPFMTKRKHMTYRDFERSTRNGQEYHTKSVRQALVVHH